jgi:hypothetical protein
VRLNVRYQPFAAGENFDPLLIPIETVGLEFFKGLEDFVFEESRYQLLPNITVLPSTENNFYNAEDDILETGQGSSLFFVKGQPNIYGLGGIAPSRFSIAPNRQAIASILELLISPQTFFYPDFPGLFTRPFLIKDKIPQLISRLDELYVEAFPQVNPNQFVSRELKFRPPNPSTNTGSGVLVVNNIGFELAGVEYRVEYEPLVQTDILSFSSEELADQANEIETQQFFNQQGNIFDNRSLSELHNRILKRSRGSNEIYTVINQSFDDLIPLGTRLDGFVLSAANHVVNNKNIITDYILTEKFAKLNKFVSVLERYRQFSIPQEDIVFRQVSKDIFAKFEKEPKTTEFSENLFVEDYIGTKEIEAIEFIFGNSETQQYFPTSHYSFNNQIRFEVSLPTNTKSGDRSRPAPVVANQSLRAVEPILYVEEITGFLEDANIKLVEETIEDQLN